mmetsp:Transcript_24204/g.61569  ORF Transcript_24204/g.61569 Transcript_24204/m.61569 type:complete len:94 (+) Transcript_24204:54-335(+)
MTAAQWAFCGLLLTLTHIVSGHGICKSAYCSRGKVGKFTGDIREAAALHEFIGKVAYRNELIFTIITVNDRDGWMGGFFLNMVQLHADLERLG